VISDLLREEDYFGRFRLVFHSLPHNRWRESCGQTVETVHREVESRRGDPIMQSG